LPNSEADYEISIFESKRRFLSLFQEMQKTQSGDGERKLRVKMDKTQKLWGAHRVFIDEL
jgi:hypothetical protein